MRSQKTERRREKQSAYNDLHNITPATIKKNVADILSGLYDGDTDMGRVTAKVEIQVPGDNLAAHLDALRKEMLEAAENLEFERGREVA